jgi:hypothetical protein
MFDIDLINITCFRQVYVMVPGLFATNDTVWICPLKSSKVSTPTTSMTWSAPCTPMKWRVTLSPWLTTI